MQRLFSTARVRKAQLAGATQQTQLSKMLSTLEKEIHTIRDFTAARCRQHSPFFTPTQHCRHPHQTPIQPSDIPEATIQRRPVKPAGKINPEHANSSKRLESHYCYLSLQLGPLRTSFMLPDSPPTEPPGTLSRPLRRSAASEHPGGGPAANEHPGGGPPSTTA